MSTDTEKRNRLVVEGQGMEGAGKLPFVPMSSFLDGNQDEASIAPNLPKHPGMDAFRKNFQELERAEDVSSIWVKLDLEYEVYPGEEWPFANSVYVVTTASAAEIDGRLGALENDPSVIEEGDDLAAIVAVVGKLGEGEQVVAVWWD